MPRSSRSGSDRQLRAVVAVLLAVLVGGALTAAVASALRGSSAQSTGRVVAVPVTPGVGATAPAKPPVLGTGPGLAARSGATLSAAPQPVTPVEPPVVTVPAPTKPSVAVGRPNRGRLVNGVLLPAEGADHATWDAIDQVAPNRDWRRVGTDRLVRTLLTVAAAYRRANPDAPRVVISDLSLPQGGRFGREYGGLGHASHQNGLDVDIAYPRKDGEETGIRRVSEIDRRLAQDLVDRFVKAGAQYVFIGPRTGLRGPRRVVQPLGNHDDHLHVRLPG